MPRERPVPVRASTYALPGADLAIHNAFFQFCFSRLSIMRSTGDIAIFLFQVYITQLLCSIRIPLLAGIFDHLPAPKNADIAHQNIGACIDASSLRSARFSKKRCPATSSISSTLHHQIAQIPCEIRDKPPNTNLRSRASSHGLDYAVMYFYRGSIRSRRLKISVSTCSSVSALYCHGGSSPGKSDTLIEGLTRHASSRLPPWRYSATPCLAPCFCSASISSRAGQ